MQLELRVSAGEAVRSPFAGGTGAVSGYNLREAVARRKNLPGVGSWVSERLRRVCHWGFSGQQAQGSCRSKKRG